LARSWIHKCQRNHTKCVNSSNPSLPTRVLDITGVSTSKSVLIRQSKLGETGRYACLSYSWGHAWSKDSFEHLARSAYKKPLPVSHLPATFNDAVEVARSLNLDYLWIDALCIWQTDSIDLQKELSKMNRYYRDSTIVI
ncbi:HET-domain-containing protein, partial [Viridothelium virens]